MTRWLRAPGAAVQQLRQAARAWPTTRADGTVAILSSLVAWVFVAAAGLFFAAAAGFYSHLLSDPVASALIRADGLPLLASFCGVVLFLPMVLGARLGLWQEARRRQRRRAMQERQGRMREADRRRVARQNRVQAGVPLWPDPDVTRGDRVLIGALLYLLLGSSSTTKTVPCGTVMSCPPFREDDPWPRHQPSTRGMMPRMPQPYGAKCGRRSLVCIV